MTGSPGWRTGYLSIQLERRSVSGGIDPLGAAYLWRHLE